MTDLNTAIQNGFEAADIDALRNYCDRVGIAYSKSHNVNTLKKMLIAAVAEGSKHYGESFDEAVNIMTPDEKQIEISRLVKLNLKAQAGWEGRRRKIILHRAMAHESTRPQFFAWGRLHCYVPMGVECSVPTPIFNILVNTAGQRLTRIRRQDDEGRIYFEDKWVPTQRFMYTDLGDDPATAHLPESMIDMVRMLHGLTDGFEGYSVRQLREICSRLFIGVKEGWERADFLGAIEAKCGLSAGRVDIGSPDIARAATG